MNRAGLKEAARRCVYDAKCSGESPNPTLVTLVYFIVVAVVSTLATQASNSLTNMGDLMAAQHDGFAIRSAMAYFGSANAMLASSGIQMLSSLFSSLCAVGYISYVLNLSRGRKSDYGDLAAGFKHFGRVFVLWLLMIIFVTLWSLLFVIPGIVAAYRYRMAYYILLDDPGISALDAIRASKRLTAGHKGELFVLDLSFIGWHLLCMITCGILYIWKLPYINATYAHAYNWLLSLNASV